MKKAGRPQKLYDFRGQKVGLTTLARLFGFPVKTLHYRVNELGLSLERAVQKARVRKHEIRRNLDNSDNSV